MWACSYSIGRTIPIAEWSLWWLYQVWTHREISRRAWVLVVQARREMSSCWRVEKNDSAGALSKALPVLPVDRAMPSRRQAFANASEVYWPDSTGRRNTLMMEVFVMVAMVERQREVRLYRGQVPSPGRPTVAWRQDRVRFWGAVAGGEKTGDAAAAAGVSSPVGYRWFRQAGGVNPCLPPAVSGRCLSFAEREDIALWRAQGAGVREIARRLGRSASTVSRELRRNASTRTFRLEYKATIIAGGVRWSV